MEEMAAMINSALAAHGYKRPEAHATIWANKEGTVQRVYLNGKKANGYVHLVDGKWEAQGISYMTLLRIVEEVIAIVQ